MRRLAAVLAASLVLVACAATGPIEAPVGLELVIDIRNSSERELDVAYEFSAATTSGGGETPVAPCQRLPFPVGEVARASSYTVQIEGKTVVEGTVPASAPEGASWVVNVVIRPDGTVEERPPTPVEVPQLDTVALPGCG